MSRTSVIIALLLSSAAAKPALADIRASYGGPDKTTFTIDITDKGDMRTQVDDLILIFRGDQGYFLTKNGHETIAIKLEDAKQLFREHPEFISQDDEEDSDDITDRDLVPGAQITIDGRTGTAWFERDEKGKIDDTPWAVISTDPMLKPLGKGMTRLLDLLSLVRQPGKITDMPNARKVLESGGPLLISDNHLLSIDTTEIAASHMALPRILTRNEMLKMLSALK